MSNPDSFRDPLWQRDYQGAQRLLSGPPSTWFGVEAVPPAAIQTITTPIHKYDPDRIADVEAKITVQRTPNPMIRAVYFDGVAIGKVARNPYGIGWLSSADRKVMYSSIRDAALRCVIGISDE